MRRQLRIEFKFPTLAKEKSVMSASSTKIDHDPLFKLLFSHPYLVEELLRGFFSSRPWCKGLKYETLQSMRASFVAELKARSKLIQRHADSVWRVETERGSVWLIIALEFQSSVDLDMAVRMHVYRALLLQQAVREQKNKKQGRRYPAIIPIVIYNGLKPWTAALGVRDLIESQDPMFPAQWYAQQEYYLFDLSQQGAAAQKLKGNVMAGLVGLEGTDSLGVTRELVAEIKSSCENTGNEDLMKDFLKWFVKDYMVRRNPQFSKEIKGVIDMEVVVKKLEGLTSLEFRQGREEGIEEGIEKGIKKGRRQGIEEAQLRHARKLLAMGMRIEDICDVTELTPEQVDRLRNNMN